MSVDYTKLIPSGPAELAVGTVFVTAVYIKILVLSAFTPAAPSLTSGYALDPRTGIPIQYRLNGLTIFALITGGAYLGRDVWLKMLWENFAGAFWGALVLGMIVSYHFYVDGQKKLAAKDDTLCPTRRCPTVDNPVRHASKAQWKVFSERPFLEAFYIGHEWNPGAMNGRVDVKMLLYVVGATQLGLNIMAMMYGQNVQGGSFTQPSLILDAYAGLFFFFLVDYLAGEAIHIYTYDIFCERVGFKLVWGCMFFYPFFYCIGGWSIVRATFETPRENPLGPFGILACIALYFLGWILTRGANMQKYWAKQYPEDEFVFGGFMEQEFVPGSDRRLLCSGFWGLSRHINYVGEIIQASALAVLGFAASGFTDFVPLLYPIFYIALFVPRARDDGESCRQKYGNKVWSEYERLVPYALVPYVY
eukprot:Clim_evm30s224 gene=Clim_evmTU30s224